jgi:hypothetical protein
MLAMVALAISGCGSGSEAKDTQTYEQILHGLRSAALAGRTYGAERRAASLVAAKREVVHSFCEFAWEIGVNREAWKLPIRGLAARRVRARAFSSGNAYYHPIVAAIAKLNAVIDLEELTAKVLARYTRACET